MQTLANLSYQSIVEDNMTSDQIVALTEEENKALNKVDFSDDAIKGTGTSLYRNLKDIVAEASRSKTANWQFLLKAGTPSICRQH